jgi:hypothetical protein
MWFSSFANPMMTRGIIICSCCLVGKIRASTVKFTAIAWRTMAGSQLYLQLHTLESQHNDDRLTSQLYVHTGISVEWFATADD